MIFAAYLTLGVAAPGLLATLWGFWLGLAAATTLVAMMVGALSRRAGWYAPSPSGTIERDPRRQGNVSAQLALIAAWFLFERFGIEHSIWIYLIALLIVSVLAMETFALVARWRNGEPAPVVAQPAPVTAIQTPHSAPGKIAPRWVQRVAGVCLTLGALSLFRLLLEGTPHFLWGGLALLALGALLPALVVALGGGQARME